MEDSGVLPGRYVSRSAGAALSDMVRINRRSNQLSLLSRPQNFFDRASWSMLLSSDRSATSFLS